MMRGGLLAVGGRDSRRGEEVFDVKKARVLFFLFMFFHNAIFPGHWTLDIESEVQFGEFGLV